MRIILDAFQNKKLKIANSGAHETFLKDCKFDYCIFSLARNIPRLLLRGFFSPRAAEYSAAVRNGRQTAAEKNNNKFRLRDVKAFYFEWK